MLKNLLHSKKWLVWVIVALLSVALTGCYEVEHEVLRATDATKVYGLIGSYTDRDLKLTISGVPGTNDYRFKRVWKDGSDAGYFRAIPLRDNIYIIQVKFDNESSYVIDFLQFKNQRISTMVIENPYSDFERLAKQHNITYDFGFLAEMLIRGSRSDIMSFLRAHSRFTMKPSSDSKYDEMFKQYDELFR